MLRKLRGVRGKNGQGTASEYLVVILIVAAALSAMAVYLRRAYQGRVFDANSFMMQSAHGALNKTLGLEYEPYYVRSAELKTERSNERTIVLGPPGIITKTINYQKQSVSTSVQYPPKNAI
jgi:hypothetical protein